MWHNYLVGKKTTTPIIPVAAKVAVKRSIEIQPGKNNAYLTLANGQHIVLNTLQNGQVANESGVRVTKTKEGMLVYQFSPKQPDQQQVTATAWNTITTPAGGQYQVLLADGTKVWLNAASSLSFTAAFTGKERRVKLEGEAYFEVYKNSRQPFIVETLQQEIRVLGTHFNVHAYAEEELIRTSLLEGKVKISLGGEVVTLEPGQEGVNRLNGHLQVNTVAVEDRVAWKNGFFKFSNAGIKDVMQQIARWYNVEVTFSGELPLKQFNGTISRQVGIHEVLGMLKYAGVNYKINGKHITVSEQ